MDKKRPERTCVGCRQTGTKNELIRVVKTPDGNVTVDRNNKTSGRGAYLCMDPECLKKARKNKGLERSLKCQITPELYDMLEGVFQNAGTE